MDANQSGKTNIYYTPYIGNLAPIYIGSTFLVTPFSELTNITSNSSTGNAGPAAVANDSNYDLFVWSNGGTVTLTRGPAWASDVLRGTGAGTTELERVNGILTNKNAITNGPGANLGTYIGTVRSDGSSQINFVFGAIAAGSTAAVLGVWNAFNRVDVRGFVGDSTNTWTYSTASWRASDNSTTMRVSFVSGWAEDFAFFSAAGQLTTSGAFNSNGVVAIGYDSVSDPSGMYQVGTSINTGDAASSTGSYSTQALGFHFGQMLEYAQTSGTITWYGDNGPAFTLPLQTGLSYSWRY